MNKRRTWLIDSIVGVIVGLALGAIIAVNVIITAGIGYDVTIAEVFRQNTLVGVVTVAILVAGPVLGVIGVRTLRRRRMTSR